MSTNFRSDPAQISLEGLAPKGWEQIDLGLEILEPAKVSLPLPEDATANPVGEEVI